MTRASSLRYATLTSGARKLAHLLSTGKPSGRTRPALCGESRQRWVSVHSLDHPAAYPACTECTARAADLPPAPPPVRIAPSMPQRRTEVVAPQLLPEVPAPNTQANRTLRRASFRRYLAPRAPGVDDYVPRNTHARA